MCSSPSTESSSFLLVDRADQPARVLDLEAGGSFVRLHPQPASRLSSSHPESPLPHLTTAAAAAAVGGASGERTEGGGDGASPREGPTQPTASWARDLLLRRQQASWASV
jgi:hypothetical protein